MKNERQRKILELISNNDYATQEELCAALNESGYNAAQATVSRDIRELNLMKTSSNGKSQKYVSVTAKRPELSDKYIRVLKEGYVNMDMAQNILVIKTVPGMAMAVCAALDELDFYEIVGSIAGDDTIMCAVRSVGDTMAVMNKIKKLIRKG